MSEYMALYRKWRPSVFADVVGQDHITKVLRSEVSQGSVSHAYLFCGSRGTGKTTCAKILAKAVNCHNPENGDPCGKCAACLAFDNSYDILEMDAASNNSVEDIRSLCDKVSFMPIEMRKRVYIIDEVHMLSKGAFNALLKTLEEPPSHVMFILATTELNKIPPTILSRCKRFDFHRISPENMMPRLSYISEKENIGIAKDALRLVAFLASGAMRDALSMLELFVGKTDVTKETAAQALGVVGNAVACKLFTAVAHKNSAEALSIISDVYTASKDMGVLMSELSGMLRNMLVVKYASDNVSDLVDADPDVIATLRETENFFTKERIIYCLEVAEKAQNKLARSGLSPRTVTELAVVKLCDSRLDTSPEAVLERVAEVEAKLLTGIPVYNNSAPAPAAEKVAETAEKPEVKEEAPKVKKEAAEPTDDSNKEETKPAPEKADEGDTVEMLAFGELLDEIKNTNMIIYSMLNDSYAEIVKGEILKIYISPMGYFMLNDDAEKTEIIRAAASKLLGMSVRVTFEQSTSPKKGDGRPSLEEF